MRHRLRYIGGGSVPTALVTLLLAALVLAGCGATSSGVAHSATATPAVTATPTPGGPGTWATVATLTGVTAPPVAAVAHSDPRVIYETMSPPVGAAPAMLQRTSDDGTTWQTLHPPSAAGNPTTIVSLTAFVNPVDAQRVFLTVITPLTPSCPNPPAPPPPNGRYAGSPPPSSQYAQYSGEPRCTQQFVSADGGIHWQAVGLPAHGMLGDFLSATVRAGVGNLFAVFTPFAQPQNGVVPPRLVRSGDGGLTWALADGDLSAAGQAIADYMPVAGSAALFAITLPSSFGDQSSNTTPPLELWRSTNAGASWSRVGHVPDNLTSYGGVVVRAVGGGSTLYAEVIGAIAQNSPTSLEASMDGGHTWLQAPTQGASPDSLATPQLWDVLGDGSALALFARPGVGVNPQATCYAWKAGDAAWHTAAPALDPAAQPQDVWVSPADGTTPAAIWVLAQGGSGGYTLLRDTLA